MPKLNDPTMTTTNIHGTGYGFSAKRVDDVGASEVTLVGIAFDHSGSTSGLQADIERALGEIVRACHKSPRSGNLMLRVLGFDHRLDEIHGFKMLNDCNPDDYQGVAPATGGTALYDATVNIGESVIRYGIDLYKKGLDVNGILFVITDGMENGDSKMTVASCKDTFESALRQETGMESLRTVLVGLNANGGVDQYLKSFKDQAGFDQYVAVADANAKSLARLADFVSRSISSQSQALGTGGASQSLVF